MVAPLTLYPRQKEQVIEEPTWACSFSFVTNEYRLTYTCSCGTLLTAQFGFRQQYDVSVTAGYLVCTTCTKNWYYEIPLNFVFREIDAHISTKKLDEKR